MFYHYPYIIDNKTKHKNMKHKVIACSFARKDIMHNKWKKEPICHKVNTTRTIRQCPELHCISIIITRKIHYLHVLFARFDEVNIIKLERRIHLTKLMFQRFRKKYIIRVSQLKHEIALQTKYTCKSLKLTIIMSTKPWLFLSLPMSTSNYGHCANSWHD